MSKSVRASRMSLPWLYTVSSKILRKVKEEGASLTDLIYSTKGTNIKAVYGIVAEALKHFDIIDAVIEESGYGKDVKHLWIARVLVTELLLGKGELIGDRNNHSIKTAIEYQPRLKDAFETLKPKKLGKATQRAAKPRYVRVNTLLISVDEVVKHMERESWVFLPEAKSYEDFLSTVKNMNGDQFIRDYHLEDLLVFHPGAQLYEHPLYLSGELVLQDKASCIAAYLLNPKPGSVVLDMCAAPGMKTTYLAALMNNEGSLYAVEKHRKRYLTMCELVEQYCGAKSCVQRKLGDALKVDAKEAPGVEYILVDPSCTGSGIVRRVKDISEGDKADAERLRTLTAFQEKLLAHALTAFPSVQRVVYSTCSVNHEENERVVANVLARVNNFQVVRADLARGWKKRGDSRYPFASKCLRANFEEDLTDGFFIAIIERGERGLEREDVAIEQEDMSAEQENVATEDTAEINLENHRKRERSSDTEYCAPSSKKSKQLKEKRNSTSEPCEAEKKTLEETVIEMLKNRKKKKRNKVKNRNVCPGAEENEQSVTVQEKLKKSRKRNKVENESVCQEEEGSETVIDILKKSKKKKRKNVENGSVYQEVEVCEQSETVIEMPKKSKRKKRNKVENVSVYQDEEGSGEGMVACG